MPRLMDAVGTYLLLPALVVIVVLLRLAGIGDTSITQDESTMALFAQGVLERGYPFLRQAGGDFLISTYELVPYPIALSVGLLGQSELALRLPAVLFAAGTATVLFLYARQLFGLGAAALAVALYAVLPWAMYWGSNAFYPSQLQFFALLTTIAFHRILADPEVQPRWYYLTALLFGLSYLSWEGSGMLLPVFLGLALTLRWGQWYWLRSPHAWAAASAVVLLVLGQLTYRTVLRAPFTGIGAGRSDVSFASPAFTAVDYDPFFYVRELLTDQHLVLAVAFLLGVLAFRRSVHIRFLLLFVVFSVAALTMLLGYYALRYIYFTLPMILLVASASGMLLLGRQAQDPRANGTEQSRAGLLPKTAFAALLLVSSSPWGPRPLALGTGLVGPTPYELSWDMAGFGFRDLHQRLRELVEPGDVVIVQAPFPLRLYTGLDGDYFLQAVTATPVFQIPSRAPFYADKWVGNPVLRSSEELEDVLARNTRVWLVATPEGPTRSSAGEAIYDEILRRFEVIAENSDGRLFLWTHPRTSQGAPPTARPEVLPGHQAAAYH